ncbi:MAG: galactose-1-phosphate uridylyltransferase, partial [Candidatus Rokubacteria bacterium]|nr:galactose-1-phosphate uridylyltransferase [Candidatus Rokubacteria bacterium]
MPELRKDPVVGRWVIISTERSRRPSDFASQPVKPTGGPCVFCPGNEASTPPEIQASRAPDSAPNGPGWSLRVVPNKFPALRVEGELEPSGEGLYDRMSGIGAHEVIIETPDHHATLASLPGSAVGEVFRIYRERIADLKKDPRFEYVLIFKNHGEAAGASLEHPHSQLIATPIVPIMVQEEVGGAARYFKLKERCVWCDIVRQERQGSGRIILEEDGFIALAPFAPRFPFEAWVLPKTHRSAYEEISEEEADALARTMGELLRRMNRVLLDPPFNFMLHTAPLKDPATDYFHWHLEVIPKLTRVAG